MNHKRTAIMTAIVIGALIFVFVWNRREREALQTVSAGSTTEPTGSSAPAASGSATQPPPPGVRKIDRKDREALLDRMKAARAVRSGGSAGTSSGGTTPPPSLPALPGMLTKDEIRKGVRAVIPLLAECYDAAQGRLAIKTGRIEVKMHLTGEPDIGTLIESAEIGGDKHFTSDADLVECLQQTMLSVELPPIAEGGTIDVTYPIEFAPG